MAWLEIIGVQGKIDDSTLQSCATADCIIGGARHLAEIKKAKTKSGCKIMQWPRPLLDIIPLLEKHRGKHVVILATGDPLWYGIASTLTRYFNSDEMKITPALSGFQLAAAHLGWPLAKTACITAHGRDIHDILLHLAPNAKILVLAHDKNTTRDIARLLKDSGFGDAMLTALGAIGMETESIHTAPAAKWNHTPPDFHITAIACPPQIHADSGVFLPRIAGLRDSVFESDGTMTKNEIRSITLAALEPFAGALLWDLGCGAGSVGIEWMRAAAGAQAIGIDKNKTRLALARKNANALGTPGWRGMQADLRDGIKQLAHDDFAPDAIFIGGGIDSVLAEECITHLKPGGRLVANAVTTASEAVLAAMHAAHGGGLRRITISRSDLLGDGDGGKHHGWRALMPVTQWLWRKA